MRNFTKMNENEKNKTVRLLYKVVDLGWEQSETEIVADDSNGRIYASNELEPYTLFIDLEHDMMACKTDSCTGKEELLELKGNELGQELEKWANKLITA
jgi:hypothetical protein